MGPVRDNLRKAGKLLAETTEAYHLARQKAEVEVPADLGPMLRKQALDAACAVEAAAKQVAETRYSVVKHDQEAVQAAAMLLMAVLKDAAAEDRDAGHFNHLGGSA